MSTGLGPHLRLQQLGVLVHWCPACCMPHEIHLQASTHPQRRKWEWNDNMARPTFWPEFETTGRGGAACRYRIVDGFVAFSAEATHAMAGQLVHLPIYPHNPT